MSLGDTDDWLENLRRLIWVYRNKIRDKLATDGQARLYLSHKDSELFLEALRRDYAQVNTDVHYLQFYGTEVHFNKGAASKIEPLTTWPHIIDAFSTTVETEEWRLRDDLESMDLFNKGQTLDELKDKLE